MGSKPITCLHLLDLQGKAINLEKHMSDLTLLIFLRHLA
jgi:hypothetical protein